MTGGDAVAMAADWFALRPVAARTWLVAEPGHVNCFLVEGDERAVLVDTGLGLADVHAAARSLTGRPILAVNSHGHDDHRGGNWLFRDVAAHPLAAPSLRTPVPAERLAAYLAVAREQYAAYERLRADDERFFHLLTEDTTPRPLPPSADAWTVPAGPAPAALVDGERLDLGGRELTVLHTPGHSPDSLCLFDERDGLLFAGDTLVTGDFWVHLPDAEIDVFAATLRGLASRLAGSVREIYPAHTLRYRVGPDFLRRAADAFEAVAAGEAPGRPGTDLLRRPALRHDFADFSILRPLGIETAAATSETDGAPAELAAIDPELGAAFARYERALLAGDVATQQESFSASADVVRVDGDGPLVGPSALAAYRAARPTPGPRRLRALHTMRSPGETIITVSTNERLGADGRIVGLSTQTQVWARTDDGWRVIAACVAPMSDPNPTDDPSPAGGR
ncbi:hydrolase glyoxylase [Frankia sp. ACN1ag]|nr:hydrolase glyoxylase [Frankia sp. ACN1ag]